MDEEGDRKAFISRIGTFFLILGLMVLILFVASDIGDKTYFSYFFIGVILFSIGFILKRMSAPPPPPSKRFEGIRKIQQKNREAKANKEAAKKDQGKQR